MSDMLFTQPSTMAFVLPLAGLLIVFFAAVGIMARDTHKRRSGPGNFEKPHRGPTEAQLCQARIEKRAEILARKKLPGGVHLIEEK